MVKGHRNQLMNSGRYIIIVTTSIVGSSYIDSIDSYSKPTLILWLIRCVMFVLHNDVYTVQPIVQLLM